MSDAMNGNEALKEKELEQNPILIKIHNPVKLPQLIELIDEFIPPDRYRILEDDGVFDDGALHVNTSGNTDFNEIKRELFRNLYAITGKKPDWGTLTGVRPVKMAGELMESGKTPDEVLRIMQGYYFLSKEKAELIVDTYILQKEMLGTPPENSIGVYIGIPFCPTRCVYCSFASNQVPDSEIARYVPALLKEIDFCGQEMREHGLFPESVYFGGGTPTTLSAAQMETVLSEVRNKFPMDNCREFTVEAGRPDTITEEKLTVLKNSGVDRISINPQSMRQKTLDAIGRSHTPEDIEKAFRLADQIGFRVINADLIAGLPGENADDFRYSLEKVLGFGANNITVHTLAVKRASKLVGIDRDYHYKAAGIVGEMLDISRRLLSSAGFRPYYLYRQKHMAGYHENTGYALPGTENLYNVRIMDEHQSILALGAGGISKRYEAETNRLVRTANVTNYEQYISRIDEMCGRKERGFFNGN
ncbi:MAG: coproporphyrinogen dehydrogenase HemZ [Eubacteriales bacterium]|nr:coproporphyrinogen dehydrogenase HemZ [Eubacteriales bacterium]